MQLCGVDEAGRGPLIGPMVICAAMVTHDQEDALLDLGVKDSKLLAPTTRDRIYENLKKMIRYEVAIISPEEIDKHVNDPKSNLNWMEAEYTAKLIVKIKPEKAILDCPSTNINAYTKKVHDILATKMKTVPKIVSEHKADANHPVVSAASIIAKTLREQEILKLKQKYGDFGSGYPSDPKTQAFLVTQWNKVPIFRTTWEPYQAIVKRHSQAKLKDY